MLYLLDANVLIRAHNDYYPLHRVPAFWDWLRSQIRAGLIKSPLEIFNELTDYDDELADWLKDPEIKSDFVLGEAVNSDILKRVTSQGYAPDLSESEIEKIGKDPFLVAYTLASQDRVVVTKEVSRPSKIRGNRKLPDVCNDFNVKVIDDFQMYRSLDLRI